MVDPCEPELGTYMVPSLLRAIYPPPLGRRMLRVGESYPPLTALNVAPKKLFCVACLRGEAGRAVAGCLQRPLKLRREFHPSRRAIRSPRVRPTVGAFAQHEFVCEIPSGRCGL